MRRTPRADSSRAAGRHGAITLARELHRARPDVGRVAIHNIPVGDDSWGGRRPGARDLYDQTSAIYHGKGGRLRRILGRWSDDATKPLRGRDGVPRARTRRLPHSRTTAFSFSPDDVRRPSPGRLSCDGADARTGTSKAVGGGLPMRPEVAATYGEFFDRHPFNGPLRGHGATGAPGETRRCSISTESRFRPTVDVDDIVAGASAGSSTLSGRRAAFRSPGLPYIH